MLSLTFDNNFYCPDDMASHIAKLFLGEYAFEAFECSPKVILDIGANIGGFAVWAAKRWPAARIICYEPSKSNFEVLLRNTASLPQVICYNLAVTDRDGEAVLSHGPFNRGEHSLVFNYGKSEERVRTLAASSLPPADFIKIDTEGSEGIILEGLKHWPKFLAYEFHTAQLQEQCRAALPKNYKLWYSQQRRPGLGLAGWINSTPEKK